MAIDLTVFQGRAGDHNDLALPAAAALAAAYAAELQLAACTIGTPEPALSADWRVELPLALPALQAMAARLRAVMARGSRPLSVISRCAVALATLPVIASQRPDAVVVWYDSHADLNTPDTTPTGYLGGLALGGPAGLWDSGLGQGLDLANIILVGVRDLDPSEQALIDSGRVRAVRVHPDMAAELRAAIAGRPVYLHLDCDVLEPGIVPTDYAHAGGLDLAQLHGLCAVMAESEVVGVEIAELQIAFHPGGAAVSPKPLMAALSPLIAAMRRG